MAIAFDSRGPLEAKNWSFRLCLFSLPLLAKDTQCATVAYTSFTMRT